MADKQELFLSAQEEQKILSSIDDYVGAIQDQINALRVEGTDQVVSLTNHMATVRENANYTREEKAAIIAEDKKKLEKSRAVEKKNKARINDLIDQAVKYLDGNYDKLYYSKVVASCASEKEAENRRYQAELVDLKKEHENELARLKNKNEIKDENITKISQINNGRICYKSM